MIATQSDILQTLFNRYYSAALLYTTAMCSDADLAKDIVADAFVKAYIAFRRRFASPKADKAFRFALGSLLLIFETVFHIWTAVSGGYSWDMFPPFGLCAITNLLTIIALFTDHRRIVEVTLYWGLCGAFFSIIFVDITYMPPHFRFFHYFLVHFGFALGGLYFVMTGKIRPTRKGVNRSCMILLVHSLLIYTLDIVFDKNWLYMKAPAISGLPEFLSGPLYTILWMLLIAGMINLWYGILKLSNQLGTRMASRRASVRSR